MTISYPSMLSYLQAGPGKIILRLSPSSSRISPFSFLDNEQDPLARLVQGAFVTDSGATIKEVNLLIQRDRIICSEEALPGLTNVEVEHYWRQGMKMRQDKAPEHTLHLGMQIDEQGALLPFSSLFYCRKRAVFFEPPCPVCGQGLLLCQDDALLRSEGLVPYTTGLRRYLFCPSCFEKKGPQVWYALKKELDDSETVHDAQALVQRFGRLDPGVAASRDIDILPCLRCQQRASCYGPQQEVHDHIFILAFYPFYMMLMERDNLDGFHFLRLSKNVRRSDQQGTGLPRTAQDDQAVGEEFSDRTVHTLLKNIARKWRQQGQQNSPAEQASSLAETVIQQGGGGWAETFHLLLRGGPPWMRRSRSAMRGRRLRPQTICIQKPC